MKPIPMPRAAALAAWILATPAAALAHEHVAAGADAAVPGSPLLFVSADDFGAESGWVFGTAPRAGAAFAGYNLAELTFTALAATPALGGPDPEAAAPGTHVEAQIVSVEGPAGGRFGFWETPGNDLDADALTTSLACGETGGTYRFPVSENSGEPGADPYGHIHGRFFSTTLPGLYKVGFRFVDTSANGPGGGPVHAPSEVFHLLFQSGLTLARVAPSAGGIDVTFAAISGSTVRVETTAALGAGAAWKPAGDAVAGDDHLHTVTVPATSGAAFFRLVAE